MEMEGDEGFGNGGMNPRAGQSPGLIPVCYGAWGHTSICKIRGKLTGGFPKFCSIRTRVHFHFVFLLFGGHT